MRITLAVLAGLQTYEPKEVIDAIADPRPVPAKQPWHGRDVVGNRHMREEPDVLDDVPHAQPQRDRVDVRHVLLVVKDPAATWFDQSIDHLQRGRLAAA